MKKAVIYGRVSTDKKDTGKGRIQDYGRQLYDLREYAGRNGFEIVQEFAEKKSGTKLIRKELDRMIAFIREQGIKNILVTELSRIGRTGVMTRVLIEELAQEGINTYIHSISMNTLNKDGKVDDINLMIIGILADVAKKERDNMVNGITSGLRFSASKNRAKSGKYQTYGYQSVDRMLVVDQEEIKVVKEIFALYKKGLGCSQIASHLNGKKVQTRYSKAIGENQTKTKNGYVKKGTDFTWSSGTITTLLKNKLYKGERWHKGELVATSEPQIDPTLFDQVQLLMKNRNNRPIRMIRNDNYLKGIINCGICDQPYYMHKRKDGHDNAYVCLSKKLEYDGKVSYCGSPSIGIPKLLESLYYVASNTFIAKLKSSKSSHLEETESKINIKQIEIANLKKELEKNERMFSKVVKNLLEEDDDRTIKEYKKQKTEIALNIDKNNKRLKDLLSELSDLENHKKKPIRDYYTYEVFLREIKNVITKVIISKVEAMNSKSVDRIFGEKAIPVKITIKAFDNKDINYVVSRYSKKLYLLGVGNKGNLVTTIKPEPFKGAYEIGNMFNTILDKLSKKKLRKAA